MQSLMVKIMKTAIIGCAFGFLALDEENKLVDKVLFSKNPQDAAQTLANFESGRVVGELAELVNRLKSGGYDVFVFENAALAGEVQRQFGVKTEVAKSSLAGEKVRLNMEQLAFETGFAKNVEEFRFWVHNLTFERAKLKVRSAVEKRDLLLVQAIQTLDDLDRTINLFMGRLREWYGIIFPELDRLIEKHETYARLVLKLGNKENFAVENLEREDVPKEKAEQIAKAVETSMGTSTSETDMAQIQAISKNILDLYKLRQDLENYIDKTMDEVAPNVKALTGSLLGARLIALAGGLTNLARIPASTIQVIGAEKALFRSLKTGTRPPKHGIIFQHNYLHDAKKWHRGKIARALAGKLAIAARVDAFGGRYVGEELKADLEKRLDEIREKYQEPPPVKEKKFKHEKKRRKKRGGKS